MVSGSYQVAGLAVQADAQPTGRWRTFAAEDLQGNDLSIERAEEAFSLGDAPVLSQHGELIVRGPSQGGWLFESPERLAPAQVFLSADKRKIAYYLPPYEDAAAQQTKLNHLLRTALECRFCQEGVISLHASCVEVEGWAVAFTGRSGLGKSTRAAAWEEALGADWISGDRPAVRLEKQGAQACGVPWDGKEQLFCNVRRPLRCILEVRRSPENYVRRLSAEQARELIMQQSFVPMWDTEAALGAVCNARALVRRVPVYRVFCGPHEADAWAVYDILFNHPERIREEARDMKIKEGFVLRNVVDEFIVMPTGDNISRFEGAVVLNEVSAFVFRCLEHALSRDDLLSALLNEYDVDEQTARSDLDALLAQFESMGILEK